MTEIEIREATAADATQLQALEGEAFGARGWVADAVAGAFSEPGVRVLMAGRAGNRASGFIIWRDLAGEAEILSIDVAADARRAGLGRALVNACCAAARKAGAGAMFLEVDAGNASALGLYAAAGFSPCGRRRAYYKNGADALIMRKTL